MAIPAILPLALHPVPAQAKDSPPGAFQVAQAGPHGGEARSPAGRPPRGSGPVFTPSLTLSFTIGPKPKPDEARDAPIDDHTPDSVVFLLRDAAAEPKALARRAGVTVIESAPLESVRLVMVVGALAPGDTPEAAIERLGRLPGVAWAQTNHLYQALGAAARLPKSFDLQGLTREVMAAPAPGVVAMIDTAVAVNHEVFRGAILQQRLFATSMAPGAHGTAVAALLVGQGDVPGSGRGARLVNLAAFQQAGADGPALSQTRHLAKALDAAALLRPNVLNLSFGGPGDRLLEALLSAIDARGVCVAAAAGNGGRAGRAPFPASHPAVLGVTAVDERLRIYAFATPGPQVDVAAIGVDLTVAAPGGYRRVSGSSFATAFVSGALLRTPACAQSRDPAAMRAAVAAAARDLGPPGRDDIFGAGLLRLPGSAPP